MYFLDFDDLLKTIDWQLIIEQVVTSNRAFHILLYEDLLREPIGEITKIIKFLEEKSGMQHIDVADRIFCLSQNMRGYNKRKKLITIDPYTQERTKIMNSKIDLAQKILDTAGINISLSHYKRKVD